MNYVNLMRDPITVKSRETTLTIESSGNVQCVATPVPVSTFGIPRFRFVYTVTGLPQPVSGTMFIVPPVVRQAHPGRADLCSPCQPINDVNDDLIFYRGFEVS